MPEDPVLSAQRDSLQWLLLTLSSHQPPALLPALPPLPTAPCPQNNLQVRDVGTASAVGQAVLGGLCLWKGYEDQLD